MIPPISLTASPAYPSIAYLLAIQLFIKTTTMTHLDSVQKYYPTAKVCDDKRYSEIQVQWIVYLLIVDLT